MHRETKHGIPKALRYPLFMIGLLILVAGEYSAQEAGAPNDARVVIALFSMLFMILSVALR